jgi:uncharacterized phage protein (TIGR02220 family)/predicted phage replisome organizer
MFDNRKIKHLRKLPEGNSIVLIWVMLLTMAGRCNSGGMIFLTENIPYTPKMLADELDFEENTVKLALEALERFNMIVTNSGFFTIAGWEEYQNIEGMDKIREQNRLRKQRQRENQKLLADGSRDSHGTVTPCHATDIEEDKDIDKEKEYISIVSYLNEKAGTGFKATTAKTKSAIHARLAEGFTLEDFKIVIDKKCQEWIGTDMQKYLRPETLFGTKFEGYLNAKQGRNDTHAGTESDFHSARKYGNYI